jgi:hypothetical protein
MPPLPLVGEGQGEGGCSEAWQSSFEKKIPLFPPLIKGGRGDLDQIDQTDQTDGIDLLRSTPEAFGLDIGKALTRNEAVLQKNG